MHCTATYPQLLRPPGPLHLVLNLSRDDPESLRGVVEAALVVGHAPGVLPLQPVEVALEDVLAEAAHRPSCRGCNSTNVANNVVIVTEVISNELPIQETK